MRRTPQQKKAESLAKDRRSLYCNSDKAARKAVPRNKRKRNQAERRLAKQLLGGDDAVEAAACADAMVGAVTLKRPEGVAEVARPAAGGGPRPEAGAPRRAFLTAQLGEESTPPGERSLVTPVFPLT